MQLVVIKLNLYKYLDIIRILISFIEFIKIKFDECGVKWWGLKK